MGATSLSMVFTCGVVSAWSVTLKGARAARKAFRQPWMGYTRSLRNYSGTTRGATQYEFKKGKKRETKKDFFLNFKFCWIEYDRRTWCLFRVFLRAASLPLLLSSFTYLSVLASFSLARSKICNQPMRMREFQKTYPSRPCCKTQATPIICD